MNWIFTVTAEVGQTWHLILKTKFILTLATDSIGVRLDGFALEMMF